jgi:FkbM family methyltransferase
MAVSADAQVSLVSCRHGRFQVLETDTIVGRSLIRYGEWTESECALLANYLRPGDNVIDVGAHVGAHAVPLGRAIGPSGILLAFEPQELLFDLLTADLKRNGISNARQFKTGCGEKHGTAVVPAPDYSRPANFGAVSLKPRSHADAHLGRMETVPRVAIDDLCTLDHLRLIKIDTEGMEIDVLKGAEQVIRRCQPILYVENEDPSRSEALLRWLSEAGYDLYWHCVPLFRENNFNAEMRNVFGSACCINNLCVSIGEQLRIRPSLPPVADLRTHPRSALVGKAEALNQKAAELMVRRGREAEARGDVTAAAALFAKARELESRVDRAVGSARALSD